MKNTQLTCDQLPQISGGGNSLGDVASEVYNDAKSIVVFYSKRVGGVQAGRAWIVQRLMQVKKPVSLA